MKHDPKVPFAPNCIVSIERIGRGKEWPVAMREKKRMQDVMIHAYESTPRVWWTRTGTKLRFAMTGSKLDCLNLHGYYDSYATTAWNFALPNGSEPMGTSGTKLKKPGVYFTRVDMGAIVPAYIHSSYHPYVAGPTLLNGAYAIDAIPPGKYALKCWHESLEFESVKEKGSLRNMIVGSPLSQTREIKVEAGKSVTVDWVIEVPEALRDVPKERAEENDEEK